MTVERAGRERVSYWPLAADRRQCVWLTELTELAMFKACDVSLILEAPVAQSRSVSAIKMIKYNVENKMTQRKIPSCI